MRSINIRGLDSETALTFARKIYFWRFSQLHVYFAVLRDFDWWVLRDHSNDFSETLELLFAFVEMLDDDAASEFAISL